MSVIPCFVALYRARDWKPEDMAGHNGVISAGIGGFRYKEASTSPTGTGLL